jgi:hypothetical protein
MHMLVILMMLMMLIMCMWRVRMFQIYIHY